MGNIRFRVCSYIVQNQRLHMVETKLRVLNGIITGKLILYGILCRQVYVFCVYPMVVNSRASSTVMVMRTNEREKEGVVWRRLNCRWHQLLMCKPCWRVGGRHRSQWAQGSALLGFSSREPIHFGNSSRHGENSLSEEYNYNYCYGM